MKSNNQYKLALSIVALGLFAFAFYFFFKYFKNKKILEETSVKATSQQKANRKITFSKA